jgi:hypothetical protein
MSFYSFAMFFYIVILVVSVVLSVIWFLSQKDNPYLSLFDKLLIIIFAPVISLILYSFILVIYSYFFEKSL